MNARHILRRALLAATGAGIAGAVAVALHARFVAPYRPRITQLVVQLPRAHRHLEGIKIAFVTDTHLGPTFATDDLKPITNALRRERPDILLLGGDFISESPRFMNDAVPAIADMTPTARYGTWAVLGNHDVANVRTRVSAPLREIGVHVLENEAAAIETDRGVLWLAGIDDALIGRPNLEATFAQIPGDAAVISLWHEPDHAEVAARFGPFLQLSGHTHGGQVCLPRIGPIALPALGRRYPGGRYEIGDMTLYVSNGVGLYRPPVRFNCPPELVIVHLIG